MDERPFLERRDALEEAPLDEGTQEATQEAPLDEGTQEATLDEEIQEALEAFDAERKKDKRIRAVMAAFTISLIIAAPAVSYLYPSAWTLILAAALAFTIGTNLLISIVTVRVEDKADTMERRMNELLLSLKAATDRLSEFHGQLDAINIPLMQEKADNLSAQIRSALEEVAPQIQSFAPQIKSFEDIDFKYIGEAISQTRSFIETLDMVKLNGYISMLQKTEGNPYDMGVGEIEPDYEEEWEPDYDAPTLRLIDQQELDDEEEEYEDEEEELFEVTPFNIDDLLHQDRKRITIEDLLRP